MAIATPAIDTPRLRLIPLSRDDAAALIHGERPAHANWAPDYPTDSTLVAAGALLTADAEGRPLDEWTNYQMVVRADGRAIGGCGFVLGGPDAGGHVQITFCIVESARGQGYAAEAVEALVAWAKGQPEVTRVLADTACTNAAAIAVFEQAGMRRAGSDGDLVFFEA